MVQVSDRGVRAEGAEVGGNGGVVGRARSTVFSGGVG